MKRVEVFTMSMAELKDLILAGLESEYCVGPGEGVDLAQVKIKINDVQVQLAREGESDVIEIVIEDEL